MGELDFYWVEHRDDPRDTWKRREPIPACWPDAVGQLRHAAETALDGAYASKGDHPDHLLAECRHFLQVISEGGLAERPSSDAAYTGWHLRIVDAGPVLYDPIAAELRFWVIENAQGLAAVTITTKSGHTITGTLGWDDIEPHTVAITNGVRTTMLRPDRIESFTIDPRRHPREPA